MIFLKVFYIKPFKNSPIYSSGLPAALNLLAIEGEESSTLCPLVAKSVSVVLSSSLLRSPCFLLLNQASLPFF